MSTANRINFSDYSCPGYVGDPTENPLNMLWITIDRDDKVHLERSADFYKRLFDMFQKDRFHSGMYECYQQLLEERKKTYEALKNPELDADSIKELTDYLEESAQYINAINLNSYI